jgi:protein phosphatase
LRVLGFVVLLALVVAAAYMVVRWYATDNWYVTVHDSELVIYQGRPGGLLWFHPKVVDRTGVSTSDVLPIHLGDLRATVQEPSLAAAKRYVTDLRREYSSEQGNSLPPTTAAPPGSPTSAPAAASTSSP